MTQPELPIKLPNLAYFNLLDIIRGLTVIGVMFLIFTVLSGFELVKGELAWIPMTGAVFFAFGIFMLYNFDSTIELHLQRGIIQSHLIFRGRALSRTVASRSDFAAVFVDFFIVYEKESRALVNAPKNYFYSVCLLDKSGKKRCLEVFKNLEEAQQLAEQIAESWKINLFPGREKSFAIISKGPNQTLTVTYSNKEPPTVADNISSSLFWMVSITFIILFIMLILFLLRG